MPESNTRQVVVNTTPLITLAVGVGSLEPLRVLYDRVLVPLEVEQEVLALGVNAPGARVFLDSDWLTRSNVPTVLPPFLRNSLDVGEAAVIQMALNEKIGKVVIDEVAGRRIARLNGLQLTGSIGVLIKARQQGYTFDPEQVMNQLEYQGIWLGREVKNYFLANAR